jgi:DNA polymerase-3 subunit beta
VARLIEGRYPDYARVIPQNNTNTAVVAAQSLINALSRVRLFAPQSTELLVLKFGKDNIEINADNSDYSKKCCENLHVEYDSEEITIGFKANALMQSIQNIVGENVRISLSDGLHAAILEPEEKDNEVEYLSILMPMRVS